MRPPPRSETDSGQYGSNRGPDALLDAFIEHMRQIGLTGYERRNCVTGDGAKHVLYNLFEALLNEGDAISFPVPYWTSYFDIAEIVGARVALIPASAEQITRSPRSSSTKRWRTSRKCSCSTIHRIQPAWSTTKVKSPGWPLSW